MPDNGGDRRPISWPRLAGAFGALQGTFHHPVPLFCWR